MILKQSAGRRIKKVQIWHDKKSENDPSNQVIVFFDSRKNIDYVHWIPEGQTIHRHYYTV